MKKFIKSIKSDKLDEIKIKKSYSRPKKKQNVKWMGLAHATTARSLQKIF